MLGSSHFVHTPFFAKTRAPANCWVVRTLPTLSFVLEHLDILTLSVGPNEVSKASSNFSSVEYQQRFRIKPRGVRLALPLSGLLVQFWLSLHINVWLMALFFFDIIEAVLCATSTLELMALKYILA